MTFPTTYWSADELDTSYVAALYIAIERHLQIGRQLVLTRGPLGFIDWPMYLNRELLLIAVLVQVASALALGYLLVLLLSAAAYVCWVSWLLLGCFCCLEGGPLPQ